jgi:C4-dicarboxylate-binding protein DctP
VHPVAQVGKLWKSTVAMHTKRGEHNAAMNATRRLVSIAAVLAASLPSIAPRASTSPIAMRFSIGTGEDSPRGRGAQAFRRIIEARTHGRIRVDIFFNSTLYTQRDELEALQLGAVQIVCINLQALSVLGLTDFDAFELPYLFDSYDAVRRVTDGPVGAQLLGQLRNKGIEGLAFWDVGFKQMIANRPLRLPEDARGLLIRTTYSRVSDMEVRLLGAIPKPMSLPETREAVGSGAVDAAELTAPLIDTNRLDDVQTYLTLSNHAYLGSALVINRRFWDRIPDDIRAALADAVPQATAIANAAARKAEADALAALRARGRIHVIVLAEAEKRRWKQALLAVHRNSENRIPPQTLHAIYSAAGFSADGEISSKPSANGTDLLSWINSSIRATKPSVG